MKGITNLLKDLFEPSSSFIFLGGVHGVGKTTVCDYVLTFVDFHYVTASSLIKAYGVRSDNNKRVENAASNQLALIEQLDFEKRHHARLLLDGHYCLINSKAKIEPIGIEVFREINPNAFVLLKDCPDKILERLKKRDGKNWSRAFVEKFQKAEEHHALHISDVLNIPLYIVPNEEISAS